MGRRHQLFIIARIRNKYRTLAAVHHQSLYGETALQRCLRVLAVLQEESNCVPILHELRAARGKDDNFWATRDDFQPFPFIATSLLVASSFDPRAGHENRVHPLAFNTTLRQIDNNDGITVIDISNPTSLRYCFTFLDGGVRPLQASKYLWEYEKPRQEDDDVESGNAVDDIQRQGEIEARIHQNPLVERLETHELISAEVLSSWAKQSMLPKSTQEIDADTAGGPSLRDQAMDQFIDALLEDSESAIESAAEARLLSDFAPKLRTKLLSLADEEKLPSSATAVVRCIEMAFALETTVDLSSFLKLPAEHLVEAAMHLVGNERVRSLDLSHLKQLSEEDVTAIVKAGSALETLYLLEMPQISPQVVASLWNRPDSNLNTIYHTELLRRPVQEHPTLSKLQTAIQSPLIVDRKNPVKNILMARVFKGDYIPSETRKSDGIRIDWRRLGPAIHLNDLEMGKMSSICFPIDDMLLSPTKFVVGLINFFIYTQRQERLSWHEQTSDIGFIMAKSLSMASSKLEEIDAESATVIGPLPEKIFGAASVSASLISLAWPLDFPVMELGDRSIVIVSECDPDSKEENVGDEYRLAVITKEITGYKVESMEDYSEGLIANSRHQKLPKVLEFWKQNTGMFLGSIDSEEIQELLPVMERNSRLTREDPSWRLICMSWEH